MSHHDDGQSLIVKSVEHVENRTPGLAVQIAGRFVCHQDRGVGDQGSRDRHALLLASGELVRAMIEPVGKAHQLKLGDGEFMSLGSGHALVEEWDLDVLDDGEFADQVERLEHESDATSPGAAQGGVIEGCHVEPLEAIAPGSRAIEAAQNVHQGALAAATGSHDREVLAGGNLEIDAPKGFDQDRSVGLEVVLGDRFEIDGGATSDAGAGLGWDRIGGRCDVHIPSVAAAEDGAMLRSR